MMKSKATDCEDAFDLGKPHFFQVIVEDYITDRRLPIPSSFLNKHGTSLCSPISLKLPGGTKTWKIDTVIEICSSTSDHSHMWLCNEAWHQFAQHYSLKHGYSLIFEYEGGSLFTVTIFDARKGSEIQYPEETITNSSRSNIECVPKKPYFKVVISQSHLENSNMQVPWKFAERYMSKGSKKEVKVKVGEEWWALSLYRYHKQVRINGGLPCFAKDNCLEAGDVCYFELLTDDVGDEDLSFEVTIVREGRGKKKSE